MDDALWTLDHGLWNPMAIDDSESDGMMILTLISLGPCFHRCRTESAHPTGGNALNVQGNIKSTSVPRGYSEAGSCVVRGLNRVWAFRRAKGKQGGHLTPPSGCCIAESYDAGGGQLSQAPSLPELAHSQVYRCEYHQYMGCRAKSDGLQRIIVCTWSLQHTRWLGYLASASFC